MIERIDIKNFQSHKNSSLELSPGVNAIIGPTDSGKSSIIRALRWLVFNRPSGDSFRRNGAGKKGTYVWANKASRFKNDKQNEYALMGEELVFFKAMGTSVPEEVQEVLNLAPINFQSQHDTHFLLSASPGEVARYLNGVVNLDVIDSSLLHANRRVKDVGAEVTTHITNLGTLEIKAQELEWVDAADTALGILEEDEASIDEMADEYDDLDYALKQIVKRKEEVNDYNQKIVPEAEVNRLLGICNDLDEHKLAYNNLRDVVAHVQSEQLRLKEYSEILAGEEVYNKLDQAHNSFIELKADSLKLTKILERIYDTTDILATYERELEYAEVEFHELMPDECPLCGGKV